MLRNFIVTSLRILWRNNAVSTINILSLSIGITAFILILLYVHHETSYDKFNENYDRIYRLEGDDYAQVPHRVAILAKERIPEIVEITQLGLPNYIRTFNIFNTEQDNQGNDRVIRTHRIFADSSFFNVFTLPFVKGNPKFALNEPYSAVLTESAVQKLFGDQDPIGKTIVYDHLRRPNGQYHVTGVIRDVQKSHLDIDVLFSFQDSTRWFGCTYLVLSNHADPAVVAKKINDLLPEINVDLANTLANGVEYQNFYLRPLKDIYLSTTATKRLYGKQVNGKLLWSFMAIAVFILLLAIINYVNLTTARSLLRSKEVKLKKVMGSGKGLLRLQFLAESILICFISCLLALTVMQLLLPKFNQLTMVRISLLEYNTPFYWMLLFTAILATGIISGFYPALLLTSFRSVANVKGQSLSGARGILFRRLLLTFQFSISILLIIGIITNLRQLQFARSTNPGFNKEQVVLIKRPGNFEEEYLFKKAFRERLLQYADILKVTSSSNEPLGEQAPSNLEINGLTKILQLKNIDPDYFEVMGIELIEGRNFSWDRTSDSYDHDRWLILNDKISIIINETAAKEYFDESPVGNICRINQLDHGTVEAEIIGVTKDVHFQSLHHKVEPTYFTWRRKSWGWVSVKISQANISETISHIEKEWKNIYGEEPFVYSFLDEAYEQQYTSDERAATIIGYFTILAVTIACMGLFALSNLLGPPYRHER